MIPTIPLPSKIITELLEPIDWSTRYGPEAADDEDVVTACYDELVGAMQDALDRLAAERRFPVLGYPPAALDPPRSTPSPPKLAHLLRPAWPREPPFGRAPKLAHLLRPAWPRESVFRGQGVVSAAASMACSVRTKARKRSTASTVARVRTDERMSKACWARGSSA